MTCFNLSQATLTSRPADLLESPDSAGINENPVSDLSANISVLAFLTSRSNNKQLTPNENIIDPTAPEPQPDPVTDEAIEHDNPAVDTSVSPQDSPPGTTKCSTKILNLGSEHRQSQMTSIENPSAPESQRDPVITGGVIVHVKPAANMYSSITPKELPNPRSTIPR